MNYPRKISIIHQEGVYRILDLELDENPVLANIYHGRNPIDEEKFKLIAQCMSFSFQLRSMFEIIVGFETVIGKTPETENYFKKIREILEFMGGKKEPPLEFLYRKQIGDIIYLTTEDISEVEQQEEVEQEIVMAEMPFRGEESIRDSYVLAVAFEATELLPAILHLFKILAKYPQLKPGLKRVQSMGVPIFLALKSTFKISGKEENAAFS